VYFVGSGGNAERGPGPLHVEPTGRVGTGRCWIANGEANGGKRPVSKSEWIRSQNVTNMVRSWVIMACQSKTSAWVKGLIKVNNNLNPKKGE
jgi:hypothetical protein